MGSFAGLDALTPAALDGYVAARLAAGVGPAMIRQEIARLSNVINHARGRGVLGEHPLRGWKRPRRSGRDYRVVTPEEERALMAAAGPLGFALPIRLALYAGLRKGEIRTLERAALDPATGELRLRQPKTSRVKVIPLDPETRDLFLSQAWAGAIVMPHGETDERGSSRPHDVARAEPRAQTPSPGRHARALRGGSASVGGRRLRAAPPTHSDVAMVSGAPNGSSARSASRVTPRPLSWYDAQWWRTLKAAGLTGIRFHDLRHTFASRLADLGVSLPAVGELMGHAPPYTMTLRYFHVLADAKRRAILALVAPRDAPTRQVVGKYRRGEFQHT